jgi:hypothetical protein
MATGEIPKIPPPNDDDFLTRIRRTVRIASDFKKMVTIFSTRDWWDGRDVEGQEPSELDSNGHFINTVIISHGDYIVVPGHDQEIDRVKTIETSVNLLTPEGGRRYSLTTVSKLGKLAEIYYDEDNPSRPGIPNHLDVLDRFTTADNGILESVTSARELETIDLCTRGVLAVQSARRLLIAGCPNY